MRQVERSSKKMFNIYIASVLTLVVLGVLSNTISKRNFEASLLLGRQEAQDDLNDYFNHIDTDTHSRAWNDMDEDSKKYIEGKRKAIHSGGGSFMTVDKDGHARQLKKIWTAAAAAADLDSYYGGSPSKPATSQHPAAQANTEATRPSTRAPPSEAVSQLQAALLTNPALKSKLDRVHAEWFSAHRAPPANDSERRQYAALLRAALAQDPPNR